MILPQIQALTDICNRPVKANQNGLQCDNCVVSITLLGRWFMMIYIMPWQTVRDLGFIFPVVYQTFKIHCSQLLTFLLQTNSIHYLPCLSLGTWLRLHWCWTKTLLTSTGHSPYKKTKINGIILNCNGFKGADPDNTIPSSLGFAQTRRRPRNWIRAVPRHDVYSVFPPDYTLITNYFLSTLMKKQTGN